MLISFTVGNYRSFRKPTTISFCVDDEVRESSNVQFKVSTNTHKYRILKDAMFFGPNASGKSNIIKAIKFLAEIVVFPNSSDDQGLPTDTFAYNHDNTIFEVEFSYKKRVYSYQLEYNQSEVVYEKLVQNDSLVFERKRQRFNFPELTNLISADIVKTIRKTTLALFVAQNINIRSAADAYSWFYEMRRVATFDSSKWFMQLNSDHTIKERVLYALRFADLNIVDVQVEKSIVEGNNSQIARYDTYLVHQDKDGDRYRVNLRAESDGTYAFLCLVLLMLGNNDVQDITLLADEFDSHLHPSLATAMVKLLNGPSNKIQFIATTHNERLMDSLTKSQTYFVEKHYGETDVYRLSDFADTRSDVRRSTKYTEGRYGAIPMVNEPGLMGIFDL